MCRNKPPAGKDYDQLEAEYWNSVRFSKPLYGAGVPGSLTDPSVKEWNLNKLNTILDTLSENGVTIPGVNTPNLYFGM